MYFQVINDYGRTVYVNSRQVNSVLVGSGVLFANDGNTTSVLTNQTQIAGFLSNLALEDYFVDLRNGDGYGYVLNLSAIAYTDEAPPEAIFIYFKAGTMVQVDYSKKAVLEAAQAAYVESTGGGGGNGTALIETATQTSHGFTVGTVVRFDGSAWVKSQADQDSTSDVYGIVSAVTNADSFTITTSGLITVLSGLTPGVPYYLDTAVPGGLSLTSPNAPGAVSKPILLSVNSTTAIFVNMRGFIVPAGGGEGPAEVDFTLTPSTDAQVDITMQSGIFSGSVIKAWLVAVPTVDHDIADHLSADITVMPGSIVDDTGFTVYAHSNSGPLTGKYSIQWQWS